MSLHLSQYINENSKLTELSVTNKDTNPQSANKLGLLVENEDKGQGEILGHKYDIVFKKGHPNKWQRMELKTQSSKDIGRRFELKIGGPQAGGKFSQFTMNISSSGTALAKAFKKHVKNEFPNLSFEEFEERVKNVFRSTRFSILFLKKAPGKAAVYWEPNYDLIKAITNPDFLFKVLKSWLEKFPEEKEKGVISDEVLKVLATSYNKTYKKKMRSTEEIYNKILNTKDDLKAKARKAFKEGRASSEGMPSPYTGIVYKPSSKHKNGLYLAIAPGYVKLGSSIFDGLEEGEETKKDDSTASTGSAQGSSAKQKKTQKRPGKKMSRDEINKLQNLVIKTHKNTKGLKGCCFSIGEIDKKRNTGFAIKLTPTEVFHLFGDATDLLLKALGEGWFLSEKWEETRSGRQYKWLIYDPVEGTAAVGTTPGGSSSEPKKPTQKPKTSQKKMTPWARAGAITKKEGAMDIATIQNALKSYFPKKSITWGTLQEQNEPDGKWGEETYEAVVAFQEDIKTLINQGKLNSENLTLPSGKELNQFQVDGIFGKDTMQAMISAEKADLFKTQGKIKVNESKAYAYLGKLINEELDKILR